jgi:hypothetical protein
LGCRDQTLYKDEHRRSPVEVSMKRGGWAFETTSDDKGKVPARFTVEG